MKLVVDSNIVIAAMLKQGITRELLMEAPIEFVSPEHMLGELRSHRALIAKRAGLSAAEFDLLFALVSEKISVVDSDTYKSTMAQASDLIGKHDLGDVPFLALALASKCGIWSYNEKHFEGAGVRLWGTADVAAWTRSSSAS